MGSGKRKWIVKKLLWIVFKLTGVNYKAELKIVTSELITLRKSKHVIPDEVQKIMPEVARICANEETKQSSGGWKRTAVMTQLRRTGSKDRDIALAIELAIRGME